MELERVSFDDVGGLALSFEFRPGTNVIGPFDDPVVRSAIVDGINEGLRTGVPGIHVEASLDDGTSVAVFRPRGRDAMVVDVATGADLTARFADADGGVHLVDDADPVRVRSRQRRHQRLQVGTLAGGTLGPLGAVVAREALGFGFATGTIAAAAGLVGWCWWSDRRLIRAARALPRPPFVVEHVTGQIVPVSDARQLVIVTDDRSLVGSSGPAAAARGEVAAAG